MSTDVIDLLYPILIKIVNRKFINELSLENILREIR